MCAYFDSCCGRDPDAGRGFGRARGADRERCERGRDPGGGRINFAPTWAPTTASAGRSRAADARSTGTTCPTPCLRLSSHRGIFLMLTARAARCSRLRAPVQISVQAQAGENPNEGNPNGNPVRFGELDPSYTNTFVTFSGQKLFTALSANDSPCNIVIVNFLIPGTDIPATVSGFGAVFTDVDRLRDARGFSASTKRASSCFPARCRRRRLTAGCPLSACRTTRASASPNARSSAEMPPSLPGMLTVEWRRCRRDGRFHLWRTAARPNFHAADFDGDGTSDLAVWRPTTGQWFVIDSGSNTFHVSTFGVAGDIPVDGDFDGDSRADLAVFRPATGHWFRLNSAGFQDDQFGQPGDVPTPGDYDSDGKTDLSVFRPATGENFRRTSRGQFTVSAFGANGDVPIAGSRP